MKKKKYLLALLAIIVLFIAASLFLREQGDQLKTSQVKSGSIKKTIEERGTVFSKRVNTFYSDMSRKVESLHYSVGDRVIKGDVILTYENNYDLEIDRINKQIEAIIASYNEIVKGADFEEISNLKLNISTIEANLAFAKSNFEKIETLYNNNAVSQLEYDEAKNNLTVLENLLQEANNNYNKVIQGVSSNVKKQYEAQIDEAVVQKQILEKNLEQSSIKAEFDGVITELNVHQGGMTRTGVPVVEIQDDSNLGIYVEVLAEDAQELMRGMDFNIVDDDGKVIETILISRIYPKAQSKVSDLGVEQKRVRVEADLNDINYKLGSEVDIEIVLQEKNNVLLVDKDAVYEKENKKYVTIVDGNKQTEVEIITGLEDDTHVEVLSGLNENDIVLME
ncbi:MAG: HlyD family efflux transporter periplasmic adaptor subunit [Tissierellia bacterium]|jgi:HlyD family secretion protein|nr:HlyD family efflux transporter periplasmic adaptor subunit [Tissierellia bacterium]